MAVPTPPFDPDIRTRVYLWLAAAFVTCLLLANIVGVKLFVFPVDWPWFGKFSIEHTVGMLPFPITFVLTDLLNEYYGRRGARRVTWIAFAMGVLAFLLLYVARQFPIKEGIPGTATNDAFENIFGSASLMYIASMIAFLFGSMLDIFLFGAFKRATGGRMVWLRATGSTVVSQLFDSFIITFVFFDVLQRLSGGTAADFGWIIKTAATGYVLKFFIAVALTPVIYLGRWFIHTRFGMQPLPADKHSRVGP